MFAVLTPGHRVSPVMHTRYERVMWVARVARSPGPVQVMAHAMWEASSTPPTTGPFGRALHVVWRLGWQPMEGWWAWSVPGETDPMRLVQEPLK